MKRYVVGDIHGCHDQLVILLDLIRKDAGDEDYRIIFVGDYVDRGPKIADVVKTIRNLQTQGHYVIRGNHEEMILMGEMMYARETLESFGGFIPEDVSRWMEMLPKYYEDDTIIVVHAAAKPGVPMEAQEDVWLSWLRYDRGVPGNMGKHLYHGHTPFLQRDPEGAEDRTNLDTGCVFGGFLTAAAVGNDGKPTHFLRVSNNKIVDFP